MSRRVFCRTITGCSPSASAIEPAGGEPRTAQRARRARQSPSPTINCAAHGEEAPQSLPDFKQSGGTESPAQMCPWRPRRGRQSPFYVRDTRKACQRAPPLWAALHVTILYTPLLAKSSVLNTPSVCRGGRGGAAPLGPGLAQRDAGPLPSHWSPLSPSDSPTVLHPPSPRAGRRGCRCAPVWGSLCYCGHCSTSTVTSSRSEAVGQWPSGSAALGEDSLLSGCWRGVGCVGVAASLRRPAPCSPRPTS